MREKGCKGGRRGHGRKDERKAINIIAKAGTGEVDPERESAHPNQGNQR